MYLLDFGDIQFTDANIKDKLDYIHQINPEGDLRLGAAAMAELKFSLYDLNQLISDADITGREFTFKKAKTSTVVSRWDVFKRTKPDLMCLDGTTVYSVKKNVFRINGEDVVHQPTENVRCICIVNDRVYLGHTDTVSVYTLQGEKQEDIALTAFQQTQIPQGRSLNMQGDTLKEYSLRFFDSKPADFIEKTSVFTQVGIFTAVKPERKNQSVLTISSYDRMCKFNKIIDGYMANINYPITAFELLASLCDDIGVPLAVSSITNGDYSIKKKFALSNTTARAVLQWIAELSGNFAYIDSLGRVVVKFYEPTAKVYTNENFKGIRQAEFVTSKIDKLQIQVEKDDIGVIVGTGTNAYVITDNPLLYSMTDSELRPYAQVLYDKLKDFQYTPAEFNTVLDNDFECHAGELISVNGITTPVMVKRVKGLIETYCSTGNRIRDTKVTSLNQYTQRAGVRFNEIIATMEKFSVTLTEVKSETETNTSQLEILANGVTISVDQAGTSTSIKADTEITLTASDKVSGGTSTQIVSGNRVKISSALVTINAPIEGTSFTGNVYPKNVLPVSAIPKLDLTDKTSGSLAANRIDGTIDINKGTRGNLGADRISGTLSSGSIPTIQIGSGTSGNLDTSRISGDFRALRCENLQTTAGSTNSFSGWVNIKSGLTVSNAFSANGSAMIGGTNQTVGFCGVTGSQRRSIRELSTSADLYDTIARMNNIISALRTFGLFS